MKENTVAAPEEAINELDMYVYGVLLAFIEPTDPRMAAIRADVREKGKDAARRASDARVAGLRLAGERLLEAAVEAADWYQWKSKPDEDKTPAAVAAMARWQTARNEWTAVLAATPAPQPATPLDICGWDTRRGDGPLGGPCLLAPMHDGPHDPNGRATPAPQPAPPLDVERLR